ncbi:MAG: hypothetical protein NXI17_23645 [Alphaproteobacteria bacterium]|nr:hypothetical protein [Alphaproteobacteria bacterium]
MVTKYKDLLTGEDVVFNDKGGLARTPDTYNGSSNPGVLSFARGALALLTPQQLADLSIEAYEYTAPEPPEPPEPSTDPKDWPLTRRQLRLGLLGLGITDTSVLAAINAIVDTTQRAAALIEWEDAEEYNYEHPLVASLMTSVGLNADTAAPAWLAAKDL